MNSTVFISAHLKDARNNKANYGTKVYDELYEKLGGDKLERIKSYNNVWCRDFMPVKRQDGKLVQFKYAPSYLTSRKDWKKNKPNPKKIHEEVGIDPIISEIILDGGAIEVYKDQAVVSGRVFRDNPNLSIKTLIEAIKNELQLNKLHVVPEYPYDFTGHVDGIVRFIDSKTVLVNDEKSFTDSKSSQTKNFYKEKLLQQWKYSFISVFHNVGLEVKKLPMTTYKVEGDNKEHLGLYLNFLKLQDQIIMPSFNSSTDEIAAKKLNKIYGKKVHSIDARLLGREGGFINCITWSM